MNQSDVPLCVHQPIDDNTHLFTFIASKRAAIREWAAYLERLQLARHWYNRAQIHLLMDARQAVDLPIRYLFETLSDYNRSYPDLQAPQIRMAYLRSQETIILEIYQMMAELFEPPLTVQFFTDEARARRWLDGA